MSITPEQCRAGRALLGWSATELAKKAVVAYSTVADFERGARRPMTNNLLAIRAALERGGVVFIPGNGEGPGVRLRASQVEVTVASSAAVLNPKAPRKASGKRPSKFQRSNRRR